MLRVPATLSSSPALLARLLRTLVNHETTIGALWRPQQWQQPSTPQQQQWRSASSSSGGVDGAGAGNGAGAPTLKAALRSLYLRVHPDLFTDWPAEQAENQRSFQLLQEYLESAKRGRDDTGGPSSRTPYRFRFFLKQEEEEEACLQEEGDSGSSGSDAEPQVGESSPGGDGGSFDSTAEACNSSSSALQLKRVELTLPPPEPPASGVAGILSPAARKALGRLLALCGLRADLGEGHEEAAARGRLLTFLPEAAEAVRRAESGEVGWDVRAANIRGAMRLARGVMVGFGAGAPGPGPQQLELLQALARVLDELTSEGVDVSGAHIMFGGRTAMDSKGTLWLDASEEDHESWADFIGGVDLTHAAARRGAAAALRRLEGAVAGAAGVGMVFAPAALAVTEDYRLFLERLAAYAAEHGPITLDTGPQQQQQQQQQTDLPLRDLPLYVAPGPSGTTNSSTSSSSSSSEERTGFEVAEGMGCLQVPVTASPGDVYDFARRRGAAALRALSARKAAAARAEDIATRVRTRLRLRRLLRDPLIADWQFEAGAGRLLQHAGELLQHTEGLSIRVSDMNRVEGQTVDVAWDAEP